jgi:hypothetical protein
VKILGGLAETTVYLDVDGSAGVQFTLSEGQDHIIDGETDGPPVVALEDVDTKFGGTVEADVGVSVNAGATAGLSPFLDQTVSVQLFSKTFPVFKVRNFYAYWTGLLLICWFLTSAPSGILPRNARFCLRSALSLSPAYPALSAERSTSSSPSLTWMPLHPNHENVMSPFIFEIGRSL